MGHQFAFWNPQEHCAFDMFNAFEPDLFIGQGYNLSRAEIKCINLRPKMKCFLKVGIDGAIDIDTDKYPVLMATDNERQAVSQINDKDRVVVFNYCTRQREQDVIGNWTNIVPKIFGFPPAADTNTFFPEEPDPALACDIAFIGGYWPYKAQNLDRYIIPLCYPVGKYKVRIFGNQHWPVPQYMGFIQDDTARRLFSSATVVPAVHEPHSNEYGFDILSRVFNVIACKGFAISDYVASWEEDIFTDNELFLYQDPEQYLEDIEHFVNDPGNVVRTEMIEKAHKTVMEKHTYKNRAEDILEILS
jgi:spore maturation protein CgeB